ncbi:hypothetical protein HPB52_004009 [Rhipicephalus sanguineus]|uniref:Peptidase M13 C-terminal domain-containing protein n=1 Tax=Rhipicephalus sanguineus TaxID=34632 RepID=A0A9D4PJX2_RHISA|nr:hypothetical protein HPB52_004009 [Rhipicephalus sanguineus]
MGAVPSSLCSEATRSSSMPNMRKHLDWVTTRDTESHSGSDAWQSWAAATPAEPSAESPLVPPVSLDGARGPFTGSTIDYTAACTATEHRACQIVCHLAVWNEFLLPARLELREDSSSSRGPGRLSLVSYDKPSLRHPTGEELHMSATLVNALLKIHGCVTHVAVVHIWSLKSYATLLGDALRYNCNSSIRYLTLRFESFSDRSVWSALSSLVQLEGLQCLSSKECPDEFLETLSTLLRKTKSLRALRISELQINRRGWGPMFVGRLSRSCTIEQYDDSCEDLVAVDHDMKNYVVERFMQALKGNSSLKELALNESVVDEASHEAFEGYLTKNSPLSSFSVVASSDLNRFSADRVLKALLKNTTVTKAALIGLVFSEHSALLVQRVLARHRSLRSFEVSMQRHYPYRMLQGFSPWTEFDDWLAALTQNDIVEEVTFTFHTAFVFSDRNKWEAFAKQLPTRKNLKKVTIVADRDDAFLAVLCRILAQNGADDKVSFRPYNVHDNLDLLQCRGFSGVYAHLFQTPDPEFQRLLEALPSFRNVTTMRLEVWMSCMEEVSSSIIECIESATSIRELQMISSLHDASTTDHWAAVIESLSRNDSVREVRVQANVEDPRHASVLARVVKDSRRISKVHFNVGGTHETAALVRCLSDGIGDSYNLVGISIEGRLEAEEVIKDWFAVRDVTRRNASLFNRAMRFLVADECWDGFDAAALEQTSRHPVLLAKIADELRISETDAALKVRHKLRVSEDLHTFMRLAGVVRSRVECHRRVDGDTLTQLDDLNEHCWLYVPFAVTSFSQTTDPRKLVGRAALDKPAAAKHKVRGAGRRVTSPKKAATTPEGPTTAPDQAELQEDDDDFGGRGRNVADRSIRTECNNSLCRQLKDWFVNTVGRQADPCRKENTFVCDSSVTFPSFPANDTKHSADKNESSDDSANEHYKYGPIGADGDQLMKSCAEYARNPEEGVQDVLSFLSRFNLDIRHMVDDPTEDPLKRMMELSLEYGVDAPVAFSRKYDVIGEASAPFVIDVILNHEMNEFVAASRTMGEEDIEGFYQTFLRRYALVENTTIKEQLMDSDDEISEFVNDRYGSDQPVKMSIASLSNSTGVTQDRWKELLTLFGRSKHASYEHVTADEQALAMVTYLSRPDQRLHNRLVLAWHVLRYLVGPKLDVLAALNRTGAYGDLDGVVTLTPEDKCQRLVENVVGVPYKALDMLEGGNTVSIETISDVTRFMAEFQDAAAFVFRDGTKLQDVVAKHADSAEGSTTAARKQVALFPESPAGSADAEYFFRALGDTRTDAATTTEQGQAATAHTFPKLWLRRLRAWHALPPLVQALLPAMASVVNVDSLTAFFRPPYYDVRAPPAYNFAALGQIIAQAMAHELIKRQRDNPAVGERWRRFWDEGDHVTGGTVYCLYTGYNENGTGWQSRVDEGNLTKGARLDELLGSRIAYLAFLRARHFNASDSGHTRTLPGVLLSSKQLFFVMHCALSCAMGGDHGPAVVSPPDQRCMVTYKTRKRFIDTPCGKTSGERVPNECQYL